MAIDRKPLIVGNWKMNLDHLQAIAFVQKLAWNLSDAKHDFSRVEVAVIPPFTDLRSVQTLIAADKLPLALGAQDLSVHDSGAYTGEISGAFLSHLECTYAIVGHSERRAFYGETDVIVSAKTVAAIRNDVVPIICVGETAEDLERNGPSATPVAQLTAALAHVASTANLVVAYEPVWAIGSGVAASPDRAEDVAKRLREVVADLVGNRAAERTRVLYGGSVTASNIAAFMGKANIDGALVGGASLKIDEFSSIVRYQKHVTA